MARHAQRNCENTARYMLSRANIEAWDLVFTAFMRALWWQIQHLALAVPFYKLYPRPARQVKQAMENLQLVFGEEVPVPAAVHVTRWSQVRPAPHQALSGRSSPNEVWRHGCCSSSHTLSNMMRREHAAWAVCEGTRQGCASERRCTPPDTRAEHTMVISMQAVTVRS